MYYMLYCILYIYSIVVIQIFGAARISSHRTYCTYIVRHSRGSFLNLILVDGMVLYVMSLLKLAPCLSLCNLRNELIKVSSLPIPTQFK